MSFDFINKVTKISLKKLPVQKLSISDNYKKYIAFTLAEVLIVLLIIGVVASLIVPSLINDIQNQDNKIAWKKTYAVLSQATVNVLRDNAGTMVGIPDYRQAYTKYLSIDKDCSEYIHKEGNCWPKTIKQINGTSGDAYVTDVLILNNGIFLQFHRSDSSCTRLSVHNGYTNVGINDSEPHCLEILADVNGLKPPNTLGKDIFGAVVYKNKIKPYSNQLDGGHISCANEGLGCSAQYLYQ